MNNNIMENSALWALCESSHNGHFHVKWDNGRELGVAIGEDRFSVQPPEPTLLKLYLPLTADFYPRDEWGDTSEEGEEWDGRTLLDYEDHIRGALVRTGCRRRKNGALCAGTINRTA